MRMKKNQALGILDVIEVGDKITYAVNGLTQIGDKNTIIAMRLDSGIITGFSDCKWKRNRSKKTSNDNCVLCKGMVYLDYSERPRCFGYGKDKTNIIEVDKNMFILEDEFKI